MPNLRVLATCCVGLELKPLPSTGVTRLQRYCEPLRHPTTPGLSVTGVRLVVPDHAEGLPVLRALSLCTCCRHYPGAATGGTASLIRPAISAFPERVVGSACASSFSRLAQRSLALRPAHSRCHQFVARLPEGFSHFVTFMTAPVASGWSGCRMGLAPTGKAPPYHGAHPLLPVALKTGDCRCVSYATAVGIRTARRVTCEQTPTPEVVYLPVRRNF